MGKICGWEMYRMVALDEINHISTTLPERNKNIHEATPMQFN